MAIQYPLSGSTLAFPNGATAGPISTFPHGVGVLHPDKNKGL